MECQPLGEFTTYECDGNTDAFCQTEIYGFLVVGSFEELSLPSNVLSSRHEWERESRGPFSILQAWL